MPLSSSIAQSSHDWTTLNSAGSSSLQSKRHTHTPYPLGGDVPPAILSSQRLGEVLKNLPTPNFAHSGAVLWVSEQRGMAVRCAPSSTELGLHSTFPIAFARAVLAPTQLHAWTEIWSISATKQHFFLAKKMLFFCGVNCPYQFFSCVRLGCATEPPSREGPSSSGITLRPLDANARLVGAILVVQRTSGVNRTEQSKAAMARTIGVLLRPPFP